MLKLNGTFHRVHYLFLTRYRGRGMLSLLPIRFEHPVKGAVILCAAQREHVISVFYIPPGPGTLATHVTDTLVRRLGPATPDGIAAFAGEPIVDPLLMALEVSDQFVDLHPGLGIAGLHALQAPDHPMHFPPEEPRHGGLTPFLLPLGVVPIL